MPWFIFCPIDTFPNDVCNPNNYFLVGASPPNCPDPNLHLCAIQANNNAGKPIITCGLIIEIANAINSNLETTNVHLRPTLLCP